jgi:hypothetical protein
MCFEGIHHFHLHGEINACKKPAGAGAKTAKNGSDVRPKRRDFYKALQMQH